MSKPWEGEVPATRSLRLPDFQWAWLDAQTRCVSASLRQLVQQASSDADGRHRALRLRESCYYLMRDIAGDRAGFEDAVRALFAGDRAMLERQLAEWPLEVAERIRAALDATTRPVVAGASA